MVVLAVVEAVLVVWETLLDKQAAMVVLVQF
jgi:hypothetical protein